MTAAQFVVASQAARHRVKLEADVEPKDPGFVSNPHRICQSFPAESTKVVKFEDGHDKLVEAEAATTVAEADDDTEVARVDATLLFDDETALATLIAEM